MPVITACNSLLYHLSFDHGVGGLNDVYSLHCSFMNSTIKVKFNGANLWLLLPIVLPLSSTVYKKLSSHLINLFFATVLQLAINPLIIISLLLAINLVTILALVRP